VSLQLLLNFVRKVFTFHHHQVHPVLWKRVRNNYSILPYDVHVAMPYYTATGGMIMESRFHHGRSQGRLRDPGVRHRVRTYTIATSVLAQENHDGGLNRPITLPVESVLQESPS